MESRDRANGRRSAAVGAGSAWVVELHALGQSWPSRSTVTLLDRSTRRFSYRSQTDDGNPSHADWNWQVADAPVVPI